MFCAEVASGVTRATSNGRVTFAERFDASRPVTLRTLYRETRRTPRYSLRRITTERNDAEAYLNFYIVILTSQFISAPENDR